MKPTRQGELFDDELQPLERELRGAQRRLVRRLDALPPAREDDAPGLEDLAALAALFGGPLEPRRPPPRRRRRKKR